MTVYDSTNLSKEDTIRLNEIAEKTKDQYAITMDEYYMKYGVDPFWWFLPLASRNVNFDDTFFKICLMLLIVERIQSGKYDSIITDKEDIKRTIELLSESRGFDIRVVLCRESSSFRFWDKPLKRISGYISKVNSWARTAYIENSLRSTIPNSISTLVWGPLLLNKITEKEYEDGYFPGLKDLCNEEFYYSPYLIYNTDEKWNAIIDKINAVDTYSFIHMRYYHRWYDLFYYIRYRRYCYKLKRKKYKWDDYDITPIICASIKKGLHRSDCSYALMHYCATKRLVCEIPIKKMILWYEARPVDLAISLAIRDTGRDVKRIGYIGYTISSNMLGQSPTKCQVDNSVVPEIISTTGRYYERIIKRYAPHQKTIIAPAFRTKSRKIKTCYNNRVNTIFVALTYFPSINRDMIFILNDYFRRNAGCDIHVIVKMHPTFAGKQLREFYNDTLYFEPEYTTKDIYDCLKDADVAFTAATSASMDVILSGTYLICLCYKGQLHFTCIADEIGEDRYSIIFDIDDFDTAIDKAYDFNTTETRSKLDPKDFFVQVNKDNFEELFA